MGEHRPTIRLQISYFRNYVEGYKILSEGSRLNATDAAAQPGMICGIIPIVGIVGIPTDRHEGTHRF
ncbi:hypothetical protein PRIPAC_97835 [Pristionchus pacificus]|uniref:Uncharacterized protein n=1 Tax=Pristionchus pacificus TaxID=54126 RepID=A0A2A6D297_PRIPA|nr:hypothetical protein PRIPAC_97835 [Pristionchus pacificus]|eukprot:PDM84466.1 hypothetical protein PRIPAC_33489 [Pristionchus pacificus]